MGFDPSRPYKPNKADYLNIIFALVLIGLSIFWVLR